MNVKCWILIQCWR